MLKGLNLVPFKAPTTFCIERCGCPRSCAFLLEGKFGQGKNGYDLNYIRAKRPDTSYAWINTIFLVMNLQILLRIFFARLKMAAAAIWLPLLWVAE